ncbi:MAG: hypothetical protein E4H27_02315 [Anaerolineales bacterium]|nr:MAG: hypothetical protein E4H27_02315 [Anaerolineales bacterium]
MNKRPAKKDQHKPTDMRAYRSRSERNLVIAVVVSFLIFGSLIIGLIYGWMSLFTAVLILLPGVGIFVLVWLLLKGLERLVRDKEDRAGN